MSLDKPYSHLHITDQERKENEAKNGQCNGEYDLTGVCASL